MEKKKFNYSERYSIWKILGPNCRWCKMPVEYPDCQIDHIIPERLLEDEDLRKTVLKQYGLDESFEINSFYNWIPVHPSCNLTKQGLVIEGAPVFLQLLSEVKNKFPAIRDVCDKWEHQNKTAKIITVLEREAANGSIEKSTVTRIFAGINDKLEPIIGLTASTIDNQVFYMPVSEAWRITETQNDFYTVVKDGFTGVTPVNPTIDPKWLCSNCKHYGPWDGNKCLTCGDYSFD